MARQIIVNRSITTVVVNADQSSVITLDCGHSVSDMSGQTEFVNLVSQIPCPQCATIAATAQGLPA